MDENNMENRIIALEKYVEDRKKQQIVFPMDNISLGILNEHFLSITGKLNLLYDMWGSNYSFNKIIVKQGTNGFFISPSSMLFPFTVDISLDELTIGRNMITGEQGLFFEDQQVVLYASETDGSLPSPLVTGNYYYIVNVSGGGQVAQVSNDYQGTPINITSNGTNQYYIDYINY